MQSIYTALNSLIDSVNQGTDKTSPSHTEGKAGDLRLVKGGDGNFYLQGRFEEGWVGTVRGALKFQDKPGAILRSSDIVDTSGNVLAKNVLENPVLDVSAFGGGFNLLGTTDQVSLSGSGVGVLSTRNITLSLPQNIATTSLPQFANLGLGAGAVAPIRILIKNVAAGNGIYNVKSDGVTTVFTTSDTQFQVNALNLELSGANTGVQTIAFEQADGAISLKAPALLTSSQTITLPELTGTVCLTNAGQVITSATWNASTIGIAYGGTNNTTYTSGSVIYYDGSKLAQNNSGLFWNNSTATLRTKSIYCDTDNVFTDRTAILTLSRASTSVPASGVSFTSWIYQTSKGDNGLNFLGHGGIYIKTVEGSPRGVLYGIDIDLSPSTENNPYTANRDVTGIAMQNVGTTIGTEYIYLGAAGAPGKTPTAFNPLGLSFSHGITTEDILGTHVNLGGKATIGVDTTGLTFQGVNPRPFKASTGTISELGALYLVDTLGVGINPPVTTVHIYGTSSRELRIESTNTSSTSTLRLYGRDSGATLVAAYVDASSGGSVDIGSTSNHDTSLYSGNSERIRLGWTGVITVTAGTASTMMYLNASKILTYIAATNGQILIGSTGAIPVATTITAGSGVSIVNGAGSITISATGTGGTVTSIGWTGGIVSIATATTTPAFTIAGTSGGLVYFSSTSTWASSALLAANQIILGGGAGTAPATLGSLGTTSTVLHGNAGGVPSFGAIVNADITNATIDLTTKVTGLLPLANGGTAANLTASNGGIFYSTASVGAILSGTATANQILTSGASTTPSWQNISALLTASTGITFSGTTNVTITANLSTGVSGGQTAIGGTASSNNLTLSSTSHATKGKIIIGTSAYNENTNSLGITTTSPAYKLSMGSNVVNTVIALYDDGTNVYGMGIAGSDWRLHLPGTTANFNFYDAPAGNTLLRIVGTGGIGIGTSSPTNYVSLSGQSARTIWMERNTTSNTAGLGLTLQAGGATSAATDKAGGNLILSPGANTGTGRNGVVAIKGYTSAVSTGTGDGTQLDRDIIGCYLAPANNTVTAMTNFTLANNSAIAGTIRYAVEVYNGTDVQIEVGYVSFSATNKAGTIANNNITKFGNQQAMTSGTLTVTFTITAANPAVLSVNANSSLTPSTGYPKINYSIQNLTGQAIALQ